MPPSHRRRQTKLRILLPGPPIRGRRYATPQQDSLPSREPTSKGYNPSPRPWWGKTRRTKTPAPMPGTFRPVDLPRWRSEEHTSELQSRSDLVCRLLLEKKKRLFGELEINVANQFHEPGFPEVM